jgi:NADH dehydrogenase
MLSTISSWFSPKPPEPYRPKAKVVIVGNGLGGVAAGRELNRLIGSNRNLAEVTLVGPQDTFLFKPQLHEMISGKEPLQSMRSLFPLGKPVQFRQTEVTQISIDPTNKVLQTKDGPLPYDYLIVAVGGKTAYYGHDKAIQYAISIETTADMDKLKKSILDKLSAADAAKKKSPNVPVDLNFVVVGGGATGVETAFEIQESSEALIQEKFPGLKGVKPTVTIVEAMPDVLNGFSEKERTYLKQRLKDRGIQILANHQVQDIGPDGLKLLDKKNAQAPVTKQVNTKDPVWATGVRANPLVEQLPVERMKGNQRVVVNPFLEIPKRPDIYIIGDAGAAIDPKTTRPYPPTGQVAQQQGYFVAQDLYQKLKGQAETAKERKPFEYNHQGTMFSVGQSDGCISTGNWFITGLKANWMRRGVYYKKGTRP